MEKLNLLVQKMIHETKKDLPSKARIQAAQDRQKSYADLKRKPVEFKVRDMVMLKVNKARVTPSDIQYFAAYSELGVLHQYPRFIKLILSDLIKKFPEIPQRIEEDYHSFKDDIPLVSVYTTGDVCVRGMLIPDTFLTKEIRATNDFKEYDTVFMNVDVPMNLPQPVVSTQGMHRSAPRAHRTPTFTASPKGKKRKQIVGESISPSKTHKITIKKRKQRTPSIPPLGDDRERDAIAEATLLSLALHKTALAVEAQENVAKVREKLDGEEIEKMVEGEEDEESYASVFADSVFNDDVDDFSMKIEPGSHKEHPERVTDDDEEIEKEKKDEKVEKEKEDVEIEKEKDNANDGMGSTEIRKEQKQTPIPSPTRSPRNVSSFD
ncbi:hypothetical protein Tco_1578607 [Tanacetum coccineum]